MAINSVWCPVLQTHVTYVTDLDQRVVRVVCYEYDTTTSTCRMKRRALERGPLAQLLATRTGEDDQPNPLVSCPIG